MVSFAYVGHIEASVSFLNCIYVHLNEGILLSTHFKLKLYVTTDSGFLAQHPKASQQKRDVPKEALVGSESRQTGQDCTCAGVGVASQSASGQVTPWTLPSVIWSLQNWERQARQKMWPHSGSCTQSRPSRP